MCVYKYILFLFVPLFIVESANADTDIEFILDRHKEYLLKQGSDEDKMIPELISSFNLVEKRWNNIEYGDEQRAAWRVSDHLRNIKALAIHWSDPQSRWYKNQKIFQIIINALDDWAVHKYQNPNWWHNEIGVPQLMRDILVLTRSHLSHMHMKNYLPILKQYRIASNGANLIWSADLGLFYGLFTKDFKLIDTAVSAIINEIKLSEKDGLKPDFSFHQHGPRLQMYQYGAAFLLDNIRIAWELQNSRWAYPQDKVNLLALMLLEGWQWMARGIYTVPETMDRSSTRVDELNKADVRLYLDFFKDLVPAKADALNAMEARQNNKGESLNGFRHFPYSDFTASHHESFSFFLKTISSRTLPSESINNENLKGKLMNSSETYFMRDGDEYFNMMPVWDWEKLPGITAFEGADRIDRKPFNGSVSDGKIGFVSMDYSLMSKDRNHNISCKKSWFVYNNYVLCLMGDIKMKNLPHAYTILDQARWRDTITTNEGLLSKDAKHLENLKWLRHNDFIYFVLDGDKDLKLYADTVSGSWFSINRSYSSEKIIDRVFMPSITHQSGNASVAYVVASSRGENTKIIIQKQPFRVVRNDTHCQAVVFKDKGVAVSFYRAGDLHINDKTLYVDKPCLLLVRKGMLFVSDPLHGGGVVTITYVKKKYRIDLPEDGTVISVPI